MSDLKLSERTEEAVGDWECHVQVCFGAFMFGPVMFSDAKSDALLLSRDREDKGDCRRLVMSLRRGDGRRGGSRSTSFLGALPKSTPLLCRIRTTEYKQANIRPYSVY